MFFLFPFSFVGARQMNAAAAEVIVEVTRASSQRLPADACRDVRHLRHADHVGASAPPRDLHRPRARQAHRPGRHPWPPSAIRNACGSIDREFSWVAPPLLTCWSCSPLPTPRRTKRSRSRRSTAWERIRRSCVATERARPLRGIDREGRLRSPTSSAVPPAR